MESIVTNWSKIELRTYFLIYCANADFDAAKEDFDYIASRTDQVIYQKMLKEFSKDSDYQSIQKIQKSLKAQKKQKILLSKNKFQKFIKKQSR